MNGAFSVKVRRLIIERDEGCCVRCTRMVVDTLDYHPLAEYSIQHRRARGIGGSRDKVTSSPANGVILCGDATDPRGCHYAVEANPTEALLLGYRVPQGTDPATVPVLRFGSLVLLDAFGGVVSQEVTW